VQIQLIRSATLVVSFAGHTLLIDPMLGPAGSMDPIENTPNPRRNPLVELPFDAQTLQRRLARIDAVVVTHTHLDHWDPAAIELLPKRLPILCQPEDAARIRSEGFAEVLSVDAHRMWRNIELIRTGGRHGTGEIGRQMAPVSGFALRATGEGTLYIAGDTIFCPEVEEALLEKRPDVTVVNAGAARFLVGEPIVMTAQDVVRVCLTLPTTRVIAVHLEALNHCPLTRDELQEKLREEDLLQQVEIPEDGAVIDAPSPMAQA
jgi:L-ascorbate metabolism protein UlaG (beta-lactamase superfamily)